MNLWILFLLTNILTNFHHLYSLILDSIVVYLYSGLSICWLWVSNLFSSPTFRTSFTQYLPFVLLLWSMLSNRLPPRSITLIRIVPSIVVYVTNPNKETAKKLVESIVREKLTACINWVPGIEFVYEWKKDYGRFWRIAYNQDQGIPFGTSDRICQDESWIRYSITGYLNY